MTFILWRSVYPFYFLCSLLMRNARCEIRRIRGMWGIRGPGRIYFSMHRLKSILAGSHTAQYYINSCKPQFSHITTYPVELIQPVHAATRSDVCCAGCKNWCNIVHARENWFQHAQTCHSTSAHLSQFPQPAVSKSIRRPAQYLPILAFKGVEDSRDSKIGGEGGRRAVCEVGDLFILFEFLKVHDKIT